MAILRETAIITWWSFFWSLAVAVLGTRIFGWPLTATYMLAVLTIDPALAILRGRNRAKDPLELGERAGVELLSLAILLGIGWASGRFLGK